MMDDGNIREIFARIRAGDAGARDEFFQRNTGLIWACVKKYAGLSEKEDLFQLGAIGLLKAIDRFDPSYGVAFSTYAFPLIMGEIRRYLRDGGPVKIGRRLKEIGLQARKISDQKREETGKEPAASEIAEQLGVSVDLLLSALDATSPLVYFEEASSASSDVAVTGEFSSQEASLVDSIDLREALNKLSPRERFIVEGRFFMGKTQSEISQKIGLSQAQVCRLEKEALLKLRMLLEPSSDEFKGEAEGNTKA